MTRRERVGIEMADALIEFIHLFYNKATARGVVAALISQLKKRVKEFV